VKQEYAVEREAPFREDFSPEAEEWPMLDADTRNRLVKTLQAGKDLVNCKMSKLATVL
jgi:hypothetical protein